MGIVPRIVVLVESCPVGIVPRIVESWWRVVLVGIVPRIVVLSTSQEEGLVTAQLHCAV